MQGSNLSHNAHRARNGLSYFKVKPNAMNFFPSQGKFEYKKIKQRSKKSDSTAPYANSIILASENNARFPSVSSRDGSIEMVTDIASSVQVTEIASSAPT